MKVSVIMGVYNCKDIHLLKASVNSIINQTFTDWEFIICNDGSSDSTLQHLNEIKQLDERIKLISYTRNQGLAYALNQCVKYAKGSYIARQDDDDISERNRLECQVAFLDSHPEYAIVGTKARIFDHAGFWGTYQVEEIPHKKSFLWNSPFIHPTVMMRKGALEKSNGYRVMKETRRCEDYDLFMRMYSLGYKGYNIQNTLYQYRMINGNRKYRPMKYRIDEAVIRFLGFKALGLFPRAFLYVLKPILIGLIPQRIFKIIKKSQFR